MYCVWMPLVCACDWISSNLMLVNATFVHRHRGVEHLFVIPSVREVIGEKTEERREKG